MTDAVLLAAVLVAAAAAGIACLRALRALPTPPGERLLAGLAVGLGFAACAGLVLAATGQLRPAPLAMLAAIALAVGARDLLRVVRALDWTALRRVWPAVALGGVVLLAELPTMLAPPVGGDQTKYQLVYPRLYAEHGGLVATPWTFWGQMQFLPNFDFALGFALGSSVVPRLLNGAFGVLAALALAQLVAKHLATAPLERIAGAAAGTLFFTLPLTWSLMTRAGSDLPVVLYATLATAAFLEWRAGGSGGDLRRAALAAGLAGASKTLGLLIPALLGVAVLVVLARRSSSPRPAAACALSFAAVVLCATSPYYLRNAVETGNPVYPYAYGVFGGRGWSAAASDYFAEYYRQYRTVHAARRDSIPYTGLAVARFPWDATMHPDSFENAARQSLDVGPFLLAFAPAVLLVRRRRRAVLWAAAFGAGYAAIIAAFVWAHPRYVFPGLALVLAASVPAAAQLLGARAFALVLVLTVAGNLAVTSRLLRQLWRDQVRVAVGGLDEREFLRRHSDDYAFWERANAAVPDGGRVLVLEKVPHPYYIERPFVLASYLEQNLIDYRTVNSPAALLAAAHAAGATHVAVHLDGLDAAADPYEAAVGRLWRSFVASACDPVLRQGGYGLYALRRGATPTAEPHDHA